MCCTFFDDDGQFARRSSVSMFSLLIVPGDKGGAGGTKNLEKKKRLQASPEGLH